MKTFYRHLTLFTLLICFLLYIITNITFIFIVKDKMKMVNFDYHMSEVEEGTYVITSLVSDVKIPANFDKIKIVINNNNNCASSIKVHKNNPNYYSKGNCIIEKKTNKLVLACKNSTIPIEVKTINCRALLEMEDIENINIKYEGTVADWLNIDIELDENFVGYKSSNVNVLFNNDGKYENVEYLEIPEGVSEIPDLIFRNFARIKEVKIPSSVKRIGTSAFEYCESLVKVELSEGLVDVGDYAFAGCEKLVDINIPNSLTYFSNQMFWCCKSLKNIDIHNNIKTIGVQAFYKCAFEEIFIPENVETIMANAFDDCDKLKKISLPFIGKTRTNEGIENPTLWYIFGGEYYWIDGAPKSVEEVVIYGDAIIDDGYLGHYTQLKKIYFMDNVKVVSDKVFTNNPYWEGIIYCEAESKPSDWNENWDQYLDNVVWGYK